MNFQESLERRFKFTGRESRDNLPAVAIAREHWGPSGDHGRQALARLGRDMGYRKGVEIGTNRGLSAEMWCKNNRKLHLTCIDPYVAYNARHSQRSQDKIYEEATERLKPYNAEIIREASLDVVDAFENRSLDFLFIDGNHEFDPVMQDLIRWAPKVRGDGLVMLHDYCVFYWSGVIQAVNAFTSAHRVDPWYITQDYTPTAFWQRGAAKVK